MRWGGYNNVISSCCVRIKDCNKSIQRLSNNSTKSCNPNNINMVNNNNY